MAGHAGNWIKTGSGSAKGRQYVSTAAIRSMLGDDSDPAEFKRMAAANPDAYALAIDLLASRSTLPAGMAKARVPAPQAAQEPTSGAIPPDAPGAAGVPYEYRTHPSVYEYATGTGDPAAIKFARTMIAEAADARTRIPLEDMSTGDGIVNDGPTDRMMVMAFAAANPKKLNFAELDLVYAYQDGAYSDINQMLWDHSGVITKSGNFSESEASSKVVARLRDLASKRAKASGGSPKTIYQQMVANGALLQGIEDMRAAYDQAKRLSKVSLGMKAPFAFTTTRAQGKNHPFTAAMAGAKPGEIITARGFESTSVNPDNSWMGVTDSDLGVGVRVDYRIPQGAPGMYLNGIKGHKNDAPEEVEWTIPPGATWRVVSNTPDGGAPRVTMELVSITDPFTGKTAWPSA